MSFLLMRGSERCGRPAVIPSVGRGTWVVGRREACGMCMAPPLHPGPSTHARDDSGDARDDSEPTHDVTAAGSGTRSESAVISAGFSMPRIVRMVGATLES